MLTIMIKISRCSYNKVEKGKQPFYKNNTVCVIPHFIMECGLFSTNVLKELNSALENYSGIPKSFLLVMHAITNFPCIFI